MIERFLLDGVDAESTGTAVGGQDDRVALSGAYKAEATLTIVQTTETGTYVASNTAIVEEGPVMSGVGGHTGRLTQGNGRGPEIQNRT